MENFQAAPRGEAYLDLLHELTVEAWIYTSRIGPDRQTILVKGILNYDGVSYGLALDQKGRVHWGIRHSHTYFGEAGDWSIEGIIADAPLLPNVWNHLACTVYSSRSASIYVNGVLSKRGAITQSILSRPAEPLAIGALFFYGEPIQKFNGLIDEVAIYDRVLPADEIMRHYLEGFSRHKKPAP